MPYANPDDVIYGLWRLDEAGVTRQIYAILDAARNESIYPAVMDFDGEHCCLYGEETPEVLAKAAPHLIKLVPEDPFTDWLISEGWGDSWGIFLESKADLEELRRHFVRFITAKDESGKEFYFRYYDPRVLRVYLPTCNETEAELLFGPVHSFLIEGEDANTFIRYSRSETGWTYEIISLS